MNVFKHIESKSIEPEDLEDILVDVLKDEFGILLEDGSEVEVCLIEFVPV